MNVLGPKDEHEDEDELFVSMNSRLLNTSSSHAEALQKQQKQ